MEPNSAMHHILKLTLVFFTISNNTTLSVTLKNERSVKLKNTLTLPVPIPDEEKAFITPIEVPQRSVKKNFNLIFISIKLSEIHGAGSVKIS